MYSKTVEIQMQLGLLGQPCYITWVWCSGNLDRDMCHEMKTMIGTCVMRLLLHFTVSIFFCNGKI